MYTYYTFLFSRCGSAGEMLPWKIHPPLHWLTPLWRKAQHGLPLQHKGGLWEGSLPELPEEPLQQFGLQGQQSEDEEKHQNVFEDSCSDAIQRSVMLAFWQARLVPLFSCVWGWVHAADDNIAALVPVVSSGETCLQFAIKHKLRCSLRKKKSILLKVWKWG